MLPDPDYGLFATVVELGSFSGAARAVGLSPGMVSRRMARLERRLGVHLLHRTTRSVSLTNTGRQFHGDVVAIVAAIEQAEARVSGAQEVLSGPLRISAPTSFGRLHVAAALIPFRAENAALEIELNLSDAYVDFGDGRTDLAIRITSQVPGSMVARLLAANRRILCAAPAYLAACGTPGDLQALADHCLLAAEGQSPWRLTGLTGSVEYKARSAVRTNSSEVVREMAIAGGGIALRSLWDVGRDLAAGRLVRVLPDYEGASDVGIYAVYPHSSFIPAKVSRFADYLRAQFRPVPPWEQPS